jgi:hypothetical protein
LERALNSKLEEIDAFSAEYGNYFCTECKERVYLRSPDDKEPHFYHYRYNNDCSLSIKSDSVFINKNQIINNSIKILQQNYKERWIEAIDNLIKYNGIYLLEEKKWAINPINYYLLEKMYNIEILFPIFQILSSIDDERIYSIIPKIIENKLLNINQKTQLIENIVNDNKPISTDLFNMIINNSSLNNNTIFNIIFKKMGSMDHNKLINEKCRYIPYVYICKLLKLKNKDDIYMEYLNIKNKYYNEWNEKEKEMFHTMLINESKKQFTIKEYINLFEEDYYKFKYYV